MESSPSTSAEFWNTRYQGGRTPWDLGRIPAELDALLKPKPKPKVYSRTPIKVPEVMPKLRVLVPGCGSGYEVKGFLDAGYDVTAIDLAPAAVERTRRLVAPEFAERIIVGDFFTHDFAPSSFDIIYERFFLAALPPDRRIAYRDRMAQLLKYGGTLLGCFYYQKTKPEDGPPHGFAWGEADELFGRFFLLVKDVPITDSLPIFAGRERWQEQRRTKFVTPTA